MGVEATPEMALAAAIAAARACRICEAKLPLGPRPVLMVRPGARILLVGQAPGTRVHESGLPYTDRSGDRLRAWLAGTQPSSRRISSRSTSGRA